MKNKKSFVASRLSVAGFCVAVALLATTLSAAAQGLSCARLNALTDPAASDERSYLTASCQIERHQYRLAIEILSDLVLRDPYPVYQAELGRAYLGAKEFERARRLFRLALDSNPPDEARQVLLMYLSLAEQEQVQAKTWFATGSVAYLSDNNVNSGAKSAEVTLYGLPFVLNSDGLAKRDQGFKTTLSGVHVHNLRPTLAWQSNVTLDAVNYQRYQDYNLHQVSVETGPRWSSVNGQWAAYAPLGLSQTWLGGARFHRTATLTPQLRYAPNESGLGTVGVLAQSSRYRDATAMNSASQGLIASWRQTVGSSWSLEAGLRYVDENADDPAYSNQRATVSLGVRGSLPWGLRLTAETSVTKARYDATETWATEPRRDTRQVHSVSLSRDLPGGYYLSLGWQRWNTLSNLELYRTRRDQWMLQLSKVF